VSFLWGRKWISKVFYVNFAFQSVGEGHKPLYLWEEIQFQFSPGKDQFEDYVWKMTFVLVASRSQLVACGNYRQPILVHWIVPISLLMSVCVSNTGRLHCYCHQHKMHLRVYCFFLVKGPAADAADAPQPWDLLCNPVMKMISFFIFPCSGAPVEWNWQGKTELLGGKPVPVPLCPPQIPHWLTGIGPGPPRWEAED
jgi:hypothetical protein